MKTPDFLLYLLVMAGITYAVRLLPMLLVRKKITNTFILSFLHYMPYAVLTVMTIPAIFYSTGNIYSSVVGFLVAIFLSYNGKSLLTVAAFSSVAALITELLLRI